MKKHILTIALLLICGSVYATNNNGGDEGCRGNCGGGSTTQPIDVDQSQGQAQGQAQGQSQQANASAGASAGASNTTVVGVGVGVDSRNANTNLVGVDTRDTNTNNNTDINNVRAEGGTGIGFGGNQGQQQGISDSGNSSSTSRGGDQSQTQGIADSGNSANSNVNSNRNDSTAINEGNNAAQSTSVNFEASEIPQHTPDATAPGIFTSNACTLSGGLGVSGPGYGASVGGTKVDKACTVRENARILAGLDSALAILYLCKNMHVDIGETLGDLCHPNAPEPPVTLPEPLPPVAEPEPLPPVVEEEVAG